MNTFQLACFLAVSDTLNFARAAQRLNVTQPAVTHQIRSLEEELNAKLFRRTTRSVELTEAGRLVLHDANRMMTIAMRAEKRFEDPAAGGALGGGGGRGSGLPGPPRPPRRSHCMRSCSLAPLQHR